MYTTMVISIWRAEIGISSIINDAWLDQTDRISQLPHYARRPQSQLRHLLLSLRVLQAGRWAGECLVASL